MTKKIDIPQIVSELSDQELKIIAYHAKGFTSAEIGKKLKPKISPRTVEGNTLGLCKKFNAKNKTHLVAILAEAGVIKF